MRFLRVQGGYFLNESLVAKWDVAMRNDPPHRDDWSQGDAAAHYWEWLDEEQQLAFLDWLVYELSHTDGGWQHKRDLEEILHAGGSEWKVGDRGGNPGLEKRVPQGVADAVDAVIANSATAGALLSEAWHAAFGRNPDPEEAYEKAIKAVEEAGAELVLPMNPKATLGTMIAAVRDQGDWRLPLESASAVGAPLEMMKSLWEGQESRHGGNGYRKPTPAEAEAAVLLAVPLVQFFTAGLLARPTPPVATE
ncbi:hypothetical protein [Protaetiibacter intestinalis]|uniref:Uncharacterized protein n=1 Tax=Protaetiibacter intestinalis TaxID=2419774 RepID=A0A387BAL6_9MICO|nr:hypothetical protein [Protaetiibacter intestinalis]AYF98951.1 hypothetical protein D7I47_12285 [Protaetiibacter intestinalis]